MTKDVIAAILERRSVRKFDSKEIPQATVARLLEAAHWAPSAGNIQPWEFYVVLDEIKKRDLAEAAYNQQFISEAPVIIVVCAAPGMSEQRYRERGRDLYCLQDTAAAVQNLLLAAEGYGLGTCWVGAFDEAAVARVLGLKQELRPVAIIPVGYALEEERPPARRPIDEIIHIIGEKEYTIHF